MMQPFVKLTQSNTELLSRYATSPEVTTQATQVAEGMMRQMQDGSTRIDYPDGVLLPGNGALGRELGLSAVPMRSRFDRLNGAVIVLRRVAM